VVVEGAGIVFLIKAHSKKKQKKDFVRNKVNESLWPTVPSKKGTKTKSQFPKRWVNDSLFFSGAEMDAISGRGW
jgi:hypothetical protein